MVGCSKLESYLEVKDKFGQQVKSWAIQLQPGIAGCSLCPSVNISFKKGKGALIQHSETMKHRQSTSNSQDKQPKIFESFQGGQVNEVSLKA